MNRITTSLATLAVSALVLQSSNAAGETLDTIGARMSAIEARLSKIESNAKPGSDQREQAMIDATRNSAPTQNTAPAPKPAPAAADSTKTYVIKTGDTVGEIARKNGVPREALLQANRLSEGQPIYIGETLVIPTAPSANTAVAVNTPEKSKAVPAPKVEAPAPKAPAAATSGFHTVAKGDTLTGISRQYGTTVIALKSANSLNSDTISSGQRLRIPSAGNSSTTPPATKVSTTTTPAADSSYSYDNPLLNKSEAYGYYTVRKGDNLYALARDFFSTMSELQRINRLGTSTLIHPGDELIVPTGKYNAYHNKQSNVAAR